MRFLPHVIAVVVAFIASKSLGLFPNGVSAGMFHFEPIAVQGVFSALLGGILGETSKMFGGNRLVDLARDVLGKRGASAVDVKVDPKDWPDETNKLIGEAAMKCYQLGYDRGVMHGREAEKGDMLRQLGKVAILIGFLFVSGCTVQYGPSQPNVVPSPSVPDQAVPADLQIEVDGVLRNLPVEVAWRYHGYYLVLSERLGEYPNTGAFGAAATKVRDRLGPGSPFKDIIDRRVGPFLNPPRQLNPTELTSAKTVLSQIAAACKSHAAARS